MQSLHEQDLVVAGFDLRYIFCYGKDNNMTSRLYTPNLRSIDDKDGVYLLPHSDLSFLKGFIPDKADDVIQATLAYLKMRLFDVS